MVKLLELFTYFLMLSIAAERAVEILKTSFLKSMGTHPASYQVISGLIGGGLSFYSPPPDNVVHMTPIIAAIATGLAVSGGSSLWNTVIDAITASTKALKNQVK